MNDENLCPVRSKSEARERGRKGGKASGAARRRKRDLKKTAETMLDMKLPKGKTREALRELGVPEDDLTYMFALVANMIDLACNGNVNAAEFIRDLVEKSPAQEIRLEYLELRKLQFELHESRHEENETIATGSFLEALQPIQELFRNPLPNRNIEDYE